jgi:Helix-turn-helix domain
VRETTEITDQAAARVFDDPRLRKIVLALIPQERSLTGLAALMGMRLKLLHHHMQKLSRLGLVQIVRRQPRAGAPIKFYRATALAFFVPAELARENPDDQMAKQLRAALDRSRTAALIGVMYSHDGAGPRMRLIRNPEHETTSVEFWRELRLRNADATELAKALKALLRRFEKRSGDAGRRYIIHAALARS